MASPIESSYDRVAAEYTSRIANELQHKPFDRSLLDRFARDVGTVGTICDLGCGPGHVGRYLREQGASVVGIDLSPGMLAQARRLNPSIPFLQGSILELPLEDAALGGIVAFYSIVHIPPEDLPRAFSEIWRVLKPAGHLLVAFHVGDELRHMEEWWEHSVSLDFFSFEPAFVEHAMQGAGFNITETNQREPYPDIEYASRRAYIWARKPEVINAP